MAGHSGIGEHAVNQAQGLQSLGEARVDLYFSGDVALKGHGLYAMAGQGFERRRVFRRIGTPDTDICTGPGHGFSHSKTNTAIAAGHQGDLAA